MASMASRRGGSKRKQIGSSSAGGQAQEEGKEGIKQWDNKVMKKKVMQIKKWQNKGKKNMKVIAHDHFKQGAINMVGNRFEEV
ncbi:hypothetical protein SLEP1_g56326 [Rubroshorea leprosula]|uniref:Uncharacterized protein n=1 Tax=Rubroshorea leprosula TaxID=152421 RepID=A0AAV5MLA6_9ROSI|nr:hypothetical protein SLEP1_g56326 [Rubroshorea leprosula]